MTATAIVGSDDVCGASLRPYRECPGGHGHEFSDPARELRLLEGWATLHRVSAEAIEAKHAAFRRISPT